MTTNAGALDRAIRIVLGFAIMLMFFFGPHAWLGLAGLVLIVTGFVGFCPLYRVAGLRTCPAPKA